MIDVLIATLGKVRPSGLEHIPVPYRLFYDTSKPWAAAANRLFDQSENDVLFMDDDITLLPGFMDNVRKYYDRADIFGFTLRMPDSFLPCGAGCSINPDWTLAHENLLPLKFHNSDHVAITQTGYVAHVTASCMYVKKHVVQSGLRFQEWPGMWFEDVWYGIEAWKQGFKILYTPGDVLHSLGATKNQHDYDSDRKAKINAHKLISLCYEHDVFGDVRKGLIPSDKIMI